MIILLASSCKTLLLSCRSGRMKKNTVLVADDEKEIASLIAIHLEKEGHHVIIAKDGQEAIDRVGDHQVDLIILDIMMPKIDGYEVARRVRENYHMPIIFLSAKTSDFDKVQGLVIGADDYMTKPFHPMELIARVNAQLRRFTIFNQPQSKEKDSFTIEFGDLKISREQRHVTLHGEDIDLTPKEFDILYLLASHPKKVFTTENIFEHVWGQAYFEGANTVMVHIRTLRKKMKEDRRKEKWIKTVWGVGYTFDG